MGKRLFFILNFFALALAAQPGKEAWHWYFGTRATLDFSSGVPIPGVGPAAFNVFEGCASFSDPLSGQYLFSFGGGKIFNRNNVIMYNGNGIGVTNSTQGAIIFPKPGATGIYYLVANYPSTVNNQGLLYSIIDMSQQNGLGAVTIKNQRVAHPRTTEKLVGSRHCNGKDYWIITHMDGSNAFCSYKVTSQGVDTNAVVSSVGSVHNEAVDLFEGTGYMKLSPNGRKLAVGVNSDSLPVLELFDFNNSTGVISNPITINYTGMAGPYGLCFSPDNTKLYAVPHDSSSYLYQYDISSNNAATIIASQTLIAQVKISYNTYTGNELTGMQLGPDGKIYISRYCWGSDTLAIINNPNLSGTACNYQQLGLILAQGTYLKLGLPNFIDANYAGIQLNIPDIQLCSTFTTSIADAGGGYSNYQWNTGATTQTISISSPGQYWVTVTNDQGCQRTDTLGAYVLLPIKEDTIACDSFHSNVNQGGVLQYNWYDGSTGPVHDFTQSGNYYVDIAYVTGCGIRDSINLTVVPNPQIDLGADTTFCKGNLPMDAQCNTCTYQWSTGETTATIFAKTAGTYWVKVTDANGCTDSDTLVVSPQLAALNFVMPNIVTPNGDNINDQIDFGKYQFSQLHIEIYNRWGQKVFGTEDPDAIWKPAGDEGTYFYVGQYKIDCGVDSQTKAIKGFITLTR